MLMTTCVFGNILQQIFRQIRFVDAGLCKRKTRYMNVNDNMCFWKYLATDFQTDKICRCWIV